MISIIIPTHKRLNNLKKLLASVQRHLISSMHAQVIVISNTDDQKVKNLVNKHKTQINIEYAFSNEIGVNKARNKGITLAKNEVFIFLDDDCEIYDRSFFEKIINLHKEQAHYEIIGGYYTSPDNSPKLDQFYNQLCKEWVNYQRIGQNHWTLLGGCLSIKKKVFDLGHRFEEDIPYGSTETEFLFRLNTLGFKLLFSPDLAVLHTPKISIFKLLKKAFKQGYYSEKYNLYCYPKRFHLLNFPNDDSFDIFQRYFLIVKNYYHLFARLGSTVGRYKYEKK